MPRPFSRSRLAMELVCRDWRNASLQAHHLWTTLDVGRLDTERKLESLYYWMETRGDTVRFLTVDFVDDRRVLSNSIADQAGAVLGLLASRSLESLTLRLSKSTRGRRGIPGPASLGPAVRNLYFERLLSLRLVLNWRDIHLWAGTDPDSVFPFLEKLAIKTSYKGLQTLELDGLPCRALRSLKLTRLIIPSLKSQLDLVFGKGLLQRLHLCSTTSSDEFHRDDLFKAINSVSAGSHVRTRMGDAFETCVRTRFLIYLLIFTHLAGERPHIFETPARHHSRRR
jgi:hypothetical protein